MATTTRKRPNPMAALAQRARAMRDAFPGASAEFLLSAMKRNETPAQTRARLRRSGDAVAQDWTQLSATDRALFRDDESRFRQARQYCERSGRDWREHYEIGSQG